MNSKLELLRIEMEKHGIDGFFVPRADEFLNEWVPPCAERLAWITEFTGSNGYAVILKDKAAFFTDGRYTLQSLEQVDAKDFEILSISEDQHPVPTMLPTQWIEKNLAPGAKFGIDPWLHTMNGAKSLRAAVEKAGGVFVALESNPLDAVWLDRPAPPVTPAVPHPLQFSGRASDDKRRELADILKSKGARALAVTTTDEVCWLFNVRGNDIPHIPFALSYAIAHDDGTAEWFIDPRKMNDETRKWVGNGVSIGTVPDFTARLAELAKQKAKIWLDPAETQVKLQNAILDAGGDIHAERSPVQLMKAIKNPVEVQGTIDAHIRDGVAETRFLAALAVPGAAAKLDEMSAADLLEKFRAEGKNFKGLSFDTISGAGGHGAIVHYRVTDKSKKPLLQGPIYLFDSGGQYLDGTTDITRTVAVDPDRVTPEMKAHYTAVMKGHIRVAMAVFAEGETGVNLDKLARAPLDEAGLPQFSHGTGHGVGSYLSVHEGPQGISARASTPLVPGMVVSNEPGYYREGAYGIRIESLVVVADTGKKDADGKRLFNFKTLSLAPHDRNLIEPSLLTPEERAWLNGYHAEVRETLTPLLEKIDALAAKWLQEAAAPL